MPLQPEESVRQGDVALHQASDEQIVVLPRDAGLRLDHFLTRCYADHSRSALNKLIIAAQVRVNGQPAKSGHRLRADEIVSVCFPQEAPEELEPEHIDFPVLFEDEYLLVLSKPPGLVVHPACGHANGTLVHGLLYHCNELPASDGGRPGIVHRLDKDTSGVMLVAKNEIALRRLMADFKDRKVQKTYHALLLRNPPAPQGRIDAPIGRHPVDRKKMAVRPGGGKHAVTNYQVMEHFANGWCLVEVGIETGRTHQIRVHMAALKAPVVGDALYGGQVGRDVPQVPPRQMLHASTLRFFHPFDGRSLCCTAPLWADMQVLLDALRRQ